MKKINTKAEVIAIVDPETGLQTRGWKKCCPICGKTYETTSRSQKFCSNECCKKAQQRRQKQQKTYSETKDIVRLSARAHALAVSTMQALEELGIIGHQCAVCGSLDNLQVHHKNLNFLDNTPSNLQYLCPKCHANEHSRIESQLKAEGKTLEDLYDPSFKPLLAVLNKNLQ